MITCYWHMLVVSRGRYMCTYPWCLSAARLHYTSFTFFFWHCPHHFKISFWNLTAKEVFCLKHPTIVSVDRMPNCIIFLFFLHIYPSFFFFLNSFCKVFRTTNHNFKNNLPILNVVKLLKKFDLCIKFNLLMLNFIKLKHIILHSFWIYFLGF